MATATSAFQSQLIARRTRLEAAAGSVSDEYLNDLLSEVDAALQRIEVGSFGMCETCHDAIEPDRLETNPLCRFCLDHLSEEERSAHQHDLDLATQIQARLLPQKEVVLDGWHAHYRYEPLGAVGGDYCELIRLEKPQSIFFAVGDVSGKGVAASLLMTYLSAIFRSLLSTGCSLTEIVSQANRLLCEGTSPAHYATLVCGRTTPTGVEVCNAGHCSPLLLREHGVERLPSNGLPLGIFPDCQYTTTHCALRPEESLVLYSDGVTEAADSSSEEFGDQRLIDSLRKTCLNGAAAMADGVIEDLGLFRKGSQFSDDVTLLVLCRKASVTS